MLCSAPTAAQASTWQVKKDGTGDFTIIQDAMEAAATGDISDEPVFTPFTVRPDIRNRREVEIAMEREYPPLLRDAGIGGTTLVFQPLFPQEDDAGAGSTTANDDVVLPDGNGAVETIDALVEANGAAARRGSAAAKIGRSDDGSVRRGAADAGAGAE